MKHGYVGSAIHPFRTCLLAYDRSPSALRDAYSTAWRRGYYAFSDIFRTHPDMACKHPIDQGAPKCQIARVK